MSDGASANCPLCDSPSRRRFQVRGFWIRDCSACAHRFAELVPGAEHVGEVYGDEYFLGGGAGYRDYLADAAIMRDRGRWYGSLIGEHMPAGNLLDVGAASGFWLAGMIDAGWSGRGIEPNGSMAAHARERLGIDVRQGTLEDLADEATFDLVAMIQVVAHFYSVPRAFRIAAQRTRTGGYWLVESWNRDSISARLLGRHWHEYSPPSVLHWFSANGLARFAATFGFDEIARGKPRKRISGSHAKSLLRYRLQGSRLGRVAVGGLKLIPDRVSIPYPADDLFWMLLRKRPDR